jgi:glycosyltransferase involved in cell wall biosynthesis
MAEAVTTGHASPGDTVAQPSVPALLHPNETTPPRVSVLMAAHNAAPYIRQSILSILGQSYTDFELIVIDDASSDATAAIVAAIPDSRLRLMSSPANVGAVQARNTGFSVARGTYVAIQDADDISHPTRLARQVEHLDRHPGDVLVASDIRQMHPGGEMIQPRTGGPASPLLLDWMLHLGNPIGFSSVMMRMAAVRRLPEFLRESRRYAEDYDLYARLLAHGGLTRLPQPLLIYRVHPDSCSQRYHARMVEQTARVLATIWARDLIGGPDRDDIAALIARTISAGVPAENPAELRAVRDALSRLTEGFLYRHPECTPAEREAVALHAARLWEGLVRASLRAGTVTWPSVPFLRAGAKGGLRSRDLLGAALRGMVPRRVIDLLRPARGDAARGEPEPAPLPQDGTVPRAPLGPPVLFVAVVLHGAADAASGQDGRAVPRDAATLREGAAFALRAQAMFDRYGLRPAYLLDSATARQAASCQALRLVHDGGGCGIGGWWDQGADAASAEDLARAITEGCGVSPAFTTTEAAALIPVNAGHADPLAGLIAIPLSRGMVVPLAPVLDRAGGSGMEQARGPWGALPERDALAHDVALVPDKIASEPQIILIRAMLARAERRFFVRLHLRQGDPGSAAALDRLARVCAWFFEDLGGLPGDIRTLTADRRRRPRAEGVGG